MVAPLRDNIFNKAKSNLKYIEACAFGIPIACQDMCTYDDAQIKFKTGDEMMDNIKDILSGSGSYMRLSESHRDVAEKLWLEDNIGAYKELYTTSYGSKDRPILNSLNNIVAG